MGLSIGVNITGDEQFMKKLKGLGALDEMDFKDALGKVGDGLVSYYKGQGYESQGGVFGMPWAQLAPSTQAFKSMHYRQYASVPLMATGTMQKSFTSKATARQLVVSNTAPYFVYHQSSAVRHKIPRRVMFGINNPIKLIIKTIITADLEAKIALL